MTVAPPSPDAPAPDPTSLDQIFAEVSPRSVGGTCLFAPLPNDGVNEQSVAAFQSEPSAARDAVVRLKALGFTVHHPEASTITLTISGPPELYKQVFGVDFAEAAVPLSDAAQADRDTPGPSYLAPVTDHPEFYAEPPHALADAIEGVVFPQPHEPHALPAAPAPSSTPPVVNYFHLNVPGDLARLLRADLVQRQGVTGRGIRVAMVDSGHYRHPYFIQRGYQIMPVLLAADAALTDPSRDDSGHGTMESACLFATAPGCTLIPVKSTLRDTAAAFKVALAQNPHIINCSWGLCMRQNTAFCTGSLLTVLPVSERPLQAAIADAVRRGILVVFSAGNGHISWPAMHPEVLAVGGAYVDEHGAVQASNYSSSFVSPLFPGRAVPDLVGLVGMLPNAVYIMLPGQPGCDLDLHTANRGAFPAGDGTGPSDGWAVISGTSSAAPQIAGVAALLLEAAPGLSPASVKSLLTRAGRDVAAGSTHPACEDAPPGPHAAGPGPDLATGSGLVDAYRAYSLARLHAFVAPAPTAPVPAVAPPTSSAPPGTAPALASAATPPGATQEVVVQTATAEVRVRLAVQVTVTGVEVVAADAGTPAPAPAPESALAPDAGSASSAGSQTLDAGMVRALLDDPALRQLLLDALDRTAGTAAQPASAAVDSVGPDMLAPPAPDSPAGDLPPVLPPEVT